MHEYGKLISLEGLDSAGKSTHLPFIVDYLNKQHKNTVAAIDPGATEIGLHIRELLLYKRLDISDSTELLLYLAARQELIQQIILPNLSIGVWVVVDRFNDSSRAYQGAGRKISYADDLIQSLPSPSPDLTFLFNANSATLAARRMQKTALDYIEQESEDFFCRVQQHYLLLAQQYHMRIKMIDTDIAIADSQQIIIDHLDKLCNS